MKVVIWNGIGRFEGWMVSSLALERMRELCAEKHVKMPPHHQIISCRHDPVFVQAVEELGEKAVKCAGDELSVVDLGLNNKGYKIISISGERTHRKEIVVTPNDTDWVSTDMFATKPSMVDMACDLALDWDNEGKFELYDHKAGFKFTLPNGNVVSVAWLPGCDCERRYHAWRQGEEPCAPKGYDSKDAEVLIQGPDGERHESVSGWQSPEQVRELIKWASENAVVSNREYYDDTLGSFNLDKPDWSESTRADLEKALVETGAWEKDEAAAYSLPRLQAVCLWLMEGRYDEEGGEA